MWHDHPFSQRNKTPKIAGEVKVGVNGKEWLEKNFKRWGRQYCVCVWGGRGGGRGLAHNIGTIKNPLPTLTRKELFWKKDVLIV